MLESWQVTFLLKDWDYQLNFISEAWRVQKSDWEEDRGIKYWEFANTKEEKECCSLWLWWLSRRRSTDIMKSVAKALILATQGWMRPLYKDSNYKSISIKSAYHTQLSIKLLWEGFSPRSIIYSNLSRMDSEGRSTKKNGKDISCVFLKKKYWDLRWYGRKGRICSEWWSCVLLEALKPLISILSRGKMDVTNVLFALRAAVSQGVTSLRPQY